MDNDYRRTRYCPELLDISIKKKEIEEIIKRDHPRAEDMHTYLSNNKNKYKRIFMRVYNDKCAYCGLSLNLNSKDYFEIDHFIYKESAKFKSKKDAGYMENLVLACHECNHNKSSFLISEDIYEMLHPDKDKIKNVFYRDDMLYIKISKEASSNEMIRNFYEKLKLGTERHRLDYVLMSMIGMLECEKDKEICSSLGKAISILVKRRNEV